MKKKEMRMHLANARWECREKAKSLRAMAQKITQDSNMMVSKLNQHAAALEEQAADMEKAGATQKEWSA